jgi:hypothetical protein
MENTRQRESLNSGFGFIAVERTCHLLCCREQGNALMQLQSAASEQISNEKRARRHLAESVLGPSGSNRIR